MSTLHAFGCSITQGFALPDIVRPILDSTGRPLTVEELLRSDHHWTDIHVYEPSKYAWPSVLASKLDMPVVNYARRGACFKQIARQCAVHAKDIKPEDTVIVMWTYLSRLSLQWPARTTVPFCNVIDASAWRTVILGFNKLFGLSPSKTSTDEYDRDMQDYIHNYTNTNILDPRGLYDHCYNNLVLQSMTAGFLAATGARVIHLSVEPDSYLKQLTLSSQGLDPSLQDYTAIPDPESWYTMSVDHELCRVIHDPSIPPAENDMHPSVLHHENFASAVYEQYFKDL